MKYSEFLQLYDIYEADGKNLNESLGLPVYKHIINEDDKDIQNTNTSSSVLSLVTRWGRMKNTLNKQAKKIQEQVINNVIKKYLPDILKVERETVESLSVAIKSNKDDKELTKLLQDKQKITANMQIKKLDIIYKAIDIFLENANSTLNKKIESSKMTDKNKLNLKNYWLLLQTQIKLNTYNYISTATLNDVKKIIGNNEKALKLYSTNSSINSTNLPKVNTIKDDVDKAKEVVKKTEEEIKSGKTETNENTPVTPEINKKYKFTNYKGEEVEFTVKKINDNGTVLGTKTTDGKDYVYDQPVVNRMKPVEVEKDTTGENTTTNEPSKEPSTEPSKEEIKNRGGKVNPSL